jgi:hypothetical protein
VWDFRLQAGEESLLLERKFLHDSRRADGDFQQAAPYASRACKAAQRIAHGSLPGDVDFAVGLTSAVTAGGNQLREYIADFLRLAGVVTTLLALAACGEVNGNIGGVCHSVIRG